MKQYSISAAVSSTIAVITTGQDIYQQIAQAMDSIEAAGNLSGAEKKRWVVEFASKEIKEVFDNLEEWLPKIMNWIDVFKTAFNTLKVLF